MNKKGFDIKSGLFALIMMSMMVIAVTVIIAEYNDFYGTNLDNDLSELSALDDVETTATDYKTRLSPDGQSTENFEDETFRGAFGVIKVTFASFRVLFGVGGMFDAVASRFGIPSYIVQGVVTFMIIAIATAIVAIIFRIPRRNL